MAGEIKISALPLASAATDADVTAGVQSGTTIKQTNSALATYMATKLGLTGDFLLSANNLSDVSNLITSASNLGLSNSYLIYNDNTDHAIPNPIPEVMGFGNSSTKTFQLPAKAALNLNTFGRLYFINNYGAADQNFVDSLSNPVFTVKASTNYIFVIPDQISSNWYFLPVIGTVNGSTINNAIVDLNSAYSETSSQNFTIGNGLNIIGNGLDIVGDDNSQAQFSGAFITTLNPTDKGLLGAAGQYQIYATTPDGNQRAFDLYAGYNYYSTGLNSSFFSISTVSKGTSNAVLSVLGDNATNGTCLIIGGTDPINAHVDNVSIGVGLFGTKQASALFQIDSTTQGALLSRMSLTNRNAISSPATGLEIYNTTYNTQDYFDGTDWETVLTGGTALAGTNMTIVANGDGTFTFNAAGGGTGPTAAYASVSIQNNLISTAIGAMNTFYPISAGASFSGNNASEFTNQFLTISGVSTPVMTCTSSNTQFYEVIFNIGARGAVASQANYIFNISVRLANGTIVPTQYQGRVVLQDLIYPWNVAITANIQLNNGDSLFIQVQNTSNTNSVIANYITGAAASVAGSATSISGNAATATALQSARTINSVSFDGTANITVTSSAGTLTGTTLNSTVVSSSLTSVGTISSGTWSGSFGAVSGANLTNLTAANISAGTAGINISGNSATATSATNSTNGFTVSVGTNASYYPLFAASSSNSNQPFNLNTSISFNPNTGNLTATTFTGALSGNATTATTATNANNLLMTATTTNASYYIPIVPNTGAQEATFTSSNFAFNPSTGIMSALTVSLNNLTASTLVAADGNKNLITASGTYGISISGTATNATNVNTTSSSTNAAFLIPFVASSGGGNQALNFNSNFTYNPTSTVGMLTIAGALGIASLLLKSTISSGGSEGSLYLERGHSGTGAYAQIHYRTTTVESWATGLRQNDSNYHIYDNVAGADRILVTQTGDVQVGGGNILIGTAAKSLSYKSGANGCTGSATLVLGTVTVSTSAVAATDLIQIMVTLVGGTQGIISVPSASITAGTGFVINSSLVADTSAVKWWLLKVA